MLTETKDLIRELCSAYYFRSTKARAVMLAVPIVSFVAGMGIHGLLQSYLVRKCKVSYNIGQNNLNPVDDDKVNNGRLITYKVVNTNDLGLLFEEQSQGKIYELEVKSCSRND